MAYNNKKCGRSQVFYHLGLVSFLNVYYHMARFQIQTLITGLRLVWQK